MPSYCSGNRRYSLHQAGPGIGDDAIDVMVPMVVFMLIAKAFAGPVQALWVCLLVV